MKISYEIHTSLQLNLKAYLRELEAFRTGQKYVSMQEHYERMLREQRAHINKLKQENEKLRRENRKTVDSWYETCVEMQKEHEKEVRTLKKSADTMKKRALKAEGERDAAYDRIKQLLKEKYALGMQLEEAEGLIIKLKAQVNKDFENSSLPSSAQPVRKKKISNNRERSGKKPGGQTGHAHHPRKRQEPTDTIHLPAEEYILQDPDFKKTGRTLTKQMVGIRIVMEVTEYTADEYRNYKTGERYHAPFPDGVVDDVNYDGSIKAFLFLLNNHCCVSIDKCSSLLAELTDGRLRISKGMINQLGRQFSGKSRDERQAVIKELIQSPVLHSDCCYVKNNGKTAYVFVTAKPDGELFYTASDVKGDKGIIKTPLKDYTGCVVHDHDVSFYHYGSQHQECMAHILRYLKGSMENEPEREWNKEMHSLVREMIHHVNGLKENEPCTPEKIAEFEKRYDEILKKAMDEYENVPCSDYYRDGSNLAKRLQEYKEAHLLFLRNRNIPATNNTAERLLRAIKRKGKQAITFRSMENIEYLCDNMSVLYSLREKDENLYQASIHIFEAV